jgi:hypothetical protein
VRTHTAGARRQLHQRLLGRVDVQGLRQVSGAERRLRVREEALAILREDGHILPQASIARVVNEISDAVVGLGPIEHLLKDPDVTEVMVNGPDDVFVERKGRIERVRGRLFEGEEAVLHVIERIVAPLGLRVDESAGGARALPAGARTVRNEPLRRELGRPLGCWLGHALNALRGRRVRRHSEPSDRTRRSRARRAQVPARGRPYR